MFVKAIKVVSVYTQPVVISKRLESGKVECGCATFIRLNPDGWVLTAGHVLGDLRLFEQQKKQQAENEILISTIQQDPQLNEKQKKRKINQIPKIANRILNISYWWGYNNLQTGQTWANDFLDLAAVNLAGLPPLPPESYPVFKNLTENAEEVLVGRSLCRLGFPFHEINATFDEQRNSFDLAPGALPIPRFANDGIITRGIVMVDEQSGRTARFIETSTPGLRGQSGGPIFDVDGHIWGVQSRTMHLALGFSPKVNVGSKEVVEHQFLNVGWGTHAREVIKFLQENNISVNISNEN